MRFRAVVLMVAGVLGIAAGVLIWRGVPTSAVSDHPPFYAELRVEFAMEPHPPAYYLNSERISSVSTVRWWYGHAGAWRWDAMPSGSSLSSSPLESLLQSLDEPGTYVTIGTASGISRYDAARDVYGRAELGFRSGVIPSPTSLTLPVGPANASSVDELMEQHRVYGATVALHVEGAESPFIRPDVAPLDVRIAGEQTLLGRSTLVIEYSPTWREDDAGKERSGGVGRIWLDAERMFILRHTLDPRIPEWGNGGLVANVELTALDYGSSPAAERFTFDPPASARLIDESRREARRDCRTAPGSATGRPGIAGDVGWLRADYAPAGFASGRSGSAQDASCEPTAHWRFLEREGVGGYLLFEQRRRTRPLPETLRAASEVSVGELEGYRLPDGGQQRLLWQHGEIVALLQSDVLAFGELLRIARSTRLATLEDPLSTPTPSARPARPIADVTVWQP